MLFSRGGAHILCPIFSMGGPAWRRHRLLMLSLVLLLLLTLAILVLLMLLPWRRRGPVGPTVIKGNPPVAPHPPRNYEGRDYPSQLSAVRSISK